MGPRDPSAWRLPAASGALLAFAYFPFGLLVPNFVALVPLLAWLDARRDAGARVHFRGGLVFGAALNLMILHWMYAMLAISPLAVFAYLGLALLFAVANAVTITAVGWLRSRTGWPLAILLPACWLPMESLQALGDLRMTAQHLGHTLGSYPVLFQFADLGGLYGVGAFLLVANALAYRAWRGWRDRRSPAGAAEFLFWVGAALAYGAWSFASVPAPSRTLRVGFVQPNVPLEMKFDSSTAGEQWKRLASLTHLAAAAGAEVVLWPETARPHALFHDPARPDRYAMPDVAGLARETGTTIVVGAEYAVRKGARKYDLFNAAFVVHEDGRLDPAWSAKVYLVPFVEGVPLRRLFGPLLEDLEGPLRWISGGFEPGRPGVPLPVDSGSVGVTICFEELYFDLHRRLRNEGAGFQAILTNHAWFGRSVFQRFAANSVRFRAVENRSWFVRVSNTGISGFVDPLGRWHDEVGLFEEGFAVREIGLAAGRTLYDRAGDVPLWGAWAALVVAIAASRRREPPGATPERRGDEDEPSAPGDDVGGVPGRGPGDHGPGDDPGRDDRGARGDPSGDG